MVKFFRITVYRKCSLCILRLQTVGWNMMSISLWHCPTNLSIWQRGALISVISNTGMWKRIDNLILRESFTVPQTRFIYRREKKEWISTKVCHFGNAPWFYLLWQPQIKRGFLFHISRGSRNGMRPIFTSAAKSTAFLAHSWRKKRDQSRECYGTGINITDIVSDLKVSSQQNRFQGIFNHMKSLGSRS